MQSILRHPNIALLMGCSPTIPNIVIVYELVDNSLFNTLHMKRNVEITLPKRVKIALDCARVYLYMHNLGIVHRDIKSQNVLIDNNFMVKVCDFGLARFKVSAPSPFLTHPSDSRPTWEQERCSMQEHLATWLPSCFKSASTTRRSTCLHSARFCGSWSSAKCPSTASTLARSEEKSKAESRLGPTTVSTSASHNSSTNAVTCSLAAVRVSSKSCLC